MEDGTMDDGVETSISDDVESDLDMIGIKNLGDKILSYIEQES